MKRPLWVDRRAIVLLHAESLAEHGGLPGLKDEGALESALARPQHVYTYQRSADIAELAAAYGFGMVRNHPFNDGNKRAGFLSIGLFLGLNGYALIAEPRDAVNVFFALAAGKLSEKKLAEWVRNRMVRRQS